MKQYADLSDRAITVLCILPTLLALYYYGTPPKETFFLLLLLGWIFFFEWPCLFSPRSPLFWLIFPLYPTLSFAACLGLIHDPLYHSLIGFMLLLTFAYDGGGYFIGKAIGRHKLFPALSPNKTIEGALGGFVLAFTACLWYRGSLDPLLIGKGFIITSIVCVLACTGDMFESFLKRRVGIKDTGPLLPGHGGLLDRLDALLFVVLFFYGARTYLIAYLH